MQMVKDSKSDKIKDIGMSSYNWESYVKQHVMIQIVLLVSILTYKQPSMSLFSVDR